MTFGTPSKRITFNDGGADLVLEWEEDGGVRLRYSKLTGYEITMLDDGNGFDAVIDGHKLRIDYSTACNLYYVLRELMLNTNLGEANPEVWIKE